MKKILYTLGHAVFFGMGVLIYRFFGRTTVRAHAALVYFFCQSGGRFNEWCSAQISRHQQLLPLPSASGVLGDMAGEAGTTALQNLQRDGYHVVPGALPEAVCQRLMQFALATPASVRPMDGESKSGPAVMARYEPAAPRAVRYDYPVAELLAQPEVQDLMADASLLALAQRYLNARPRLDVLSMWWHTNFHSQPDSEAAQYYHFDLDRFKWLKVFVYLTDVGPQDGPHSFIQGSHAPGAIPQEFLQRGYARLPDEDVLGSYGAAREVRFTAPRGTIIVEDTRGLHKGNPVSGNSRLILQLQLSNSLFGTPYPKVRLPVQRSAALQALAQRAPDVVQAFL